MSIWNLVKQAREVEESHASIGVRALQRGDSDAANWHFTYAAQHRAEYYEYYATGQALRDLHDERLAELRRRVAERRR